jgi:hypothetical protein
MRLIKLTYGRSTARLAATLASVALVVTLLAACGGAQDHRGRVIARVGTTTITESTLHHWMATLVSYGYFEAVGAPAPKGLASDPPNYATCVSAAQALQRRTGSASAATSTAKLTAAQLATKCRQLYHSVGLQALSSLISVLWGVGQAAELGQAVSSQEVAHRARELQFERYPTPRSLQTYLSNSGLSLTDFRYMIKNDLLSSLVLNGFKREAGAGGQQAVVSLINASNVRWKAKTSCSSSYLVWQCRGFNEAARTPPSVAVLLEEISK